MKKIIYYLLVSILALAISVFVYGIINTGVSLKYETRNPNDCISLISGENLCSTIKILQKLIAVSGILIVGLLIFKNKILK